MTAGVGRARQDTVRFGEFELDLSTQTLTQGGVRTKLQKQPFQVLELLVTRAPAIVSREEIRQYVWGDEVYVDATQSINFCIRQIRLALGDTSTGSRFVETLPRQGYRFIAPVQGAVSPPSTPEPSPRRVPFPGRAIRQWLVPGLIASVLAIASLAVWGWSRRGNTTTVVRITPVTTFSGDEREPTVSPDGRQVAFSWGSETEQNRDIYVKTLGDQHPVRLTSDPGEDAYPAWSPDCKHIAFIRRRTGTQADVMIVPAIGGGERKLRGIRLGAWITSRVLAWSPDSKWLCFTDEVGASGHHALFLLSQESNAVRRLLPEEDNGMGDSSPAFSPDGKWLAFSRFQHPFNSKLLVQRLSPGLMPQGPPLPIVDAGINPTSPVWMSNGKGLLFLDKSRLMEAALGGSAHPFYVSHSVFGELSLAGSDHRLLASIESPHKEIWTLPLTARGLSPGGSAQTILHSSAGEAHPSFSPDGRSLAFVSNRSGAAEVWVADSDGQNPRQLTHQSYYIVGYVRWSPDSQMVAFHARAPSEPQIYIARVSDGVLTQVTQRKPGFMDPSWSADSASLYADSLENDKYRAYRIPVAGGQPKLLFEGSSLMESPDRHLMLYEKVDQSGIFARSLIGDVARNPEQLLVAGYDAPWGGFYVVADGFYYVGAPLPGRPRSFRFYRFDKRTSIDVAPAPSNLYLGLTLTPDRTRLVYSTSSQGSEDLVQIDTK